MILAGRSFLVLVLVAAIGVTGQWSGVVGEHAWRVPAAALLLALLAEGVIAHRIGLRIRRRLPAVGYLGRTLPSTLIVENPLPVPMRLETADCHAEGLRPLTAERRWAIAPGGEASAAAALTPQRLGTLHWERLDVRVLGRFRLAWWHRRLALPADVRITPDHLGAGPHRGGSTARGRHRLPSPGEGLELFGLRRYQPGDPVRDMDWKATARRGVPVVRVRETDEAISLVLAVDAGRGSTLRSGSLARLGHYVNVAARLAEAALDQGDEVALVTYADAPLSSLPAVRGIAGLRRIRDGLTALEAVPRDSNPVAAALRVRHLARQRSLVVLLTHVDEGRAGTHLLHAARLLAPRHLPLIAGLMDEDTLAMRWDGGGGWIAPYTMLAALELTRDAQRTRLRLERAGARVVQARPAELDARVRAAYQSLRRRHRV